MNAINTFENLQPDILIKNPESCRVVSAVEVLGHARSVWDIVGNFVGFPAFIPALDACEMTGSGVRSVRKSCSRMAT